MNNITEIDEGSCHGHLLIFHYYKCKVFQSENNRLTIDLLFCLQNHCPNVIPEAMKLHSLIINSIPQLINITSLHNGSVLVDISHTALDLYQTTDPALKQLTTTATKSQN